MVLRLRVEYNQAAWFKALIQKQGLVADAAEAALTELAALSVQEGRLNIAGAGKFGPKWISGLQYRIRRPTKGDESSLQTKAVIFHRFGIAGVFEHGATIAGK